MYFCLKEIFISFMNLCLRLNLAWQDQHLSFEDYCLASLTTCHFYNLGHWPLTGVLCINRDGRSGSVQQTSAKSL